MRKFQNKFSSRISCLGRPLCGLWIFSFLPHICTAASPVYSSLHAPACHTPPHTWPSSVHSRSGDAPVGQGIRTPCVGSLAHVKKSVESSGLRKIQYDPEPPNPISYRNQLFPDRGYGMDGRMSVLHGSDPEIGFKLGKEISPLPKDEPEWMDYDRYSHVSVPQENERDTKGIDFNLWTGDRPHGDGQHLSNRSPFDSGNGVSSQLPEGSHEVEEDIESPVDIELSMIRRREMLRRRGSRPSSVSPSPPPGSIVDFPVKRQAMAPAGGGFWEIDPSGQWRWVIPAISLPNTEQCHSVHHQAPLSSADCQPAAYLWNTDNSFREAQTVFCRDDENHMSSGWSPDKSEYISDFRSQHAAQGVDGPVSVPNSYMWHQTGSEGFMLRDTSLHADNHEEASRISRLAFRYSRGPKALPEATFSLHTKNISQPILFNPKRGQDDYLEEGDPQKNTTKDLEDAMLSELKRQGVLGATIEDGLEGRMRYEAQMEWYCNAAERGLSSVADGYSLLARVAAAGLRPTKGMYHGLFRIVESQIAHGNASLDDARDALNHMSSSNVGMNSETARRLVMICLASARVGKASFHDAEQLIAQVWRCISKLHTLPQTHHASTHGRLMRVFQDFIRYLKHITNRLMRVFQNFICYLKHITNRLMRV